MAATDLIKVWVLVSFYDENGLHKAGSVAYVKEEEFNPNYMKKIEGGGSGSTVEVTQIQSTGTKIATITVDSDATDIYAPEGSGCSVIDNIQLTDDDQVDSMDIDNNTYYFSTVGQVGINSEGKVTSVVLNDTEQEFTSIDNIQVDSEYCTKSFDLNGDTVSFVSIENIEEDSENKVKQFDLNGATKEFTSIENISTQGPNGEVDAMDINGTNYSFATGGATALHDLDDVYISDLQQDCILSFYPYSGNGEWKSVPSDGYTITCRGTDDPTAFSNSQLPYVRFERAGNSLTGQEIGQAINRVATYGAAICLSYTVSNDCYTYAFKNIDKDKNVIFESEVFEDNGIKKVSQIVFSMDSHQNLSAVGNTIALSSGGGSNPIAQFELSDTSGTNYTIATMPTLQPIDFDVVSGSTDATAFYDGSKTIAQITNWGNLYWFANRGSIQVGQQPDTGYLCVVPGQYSGQFYWLLLKPQSASKFRITKVV